MVLRDGSTLNKRGLAPKPPITAGRSPHQPADGAREQGLDETVDSLQKAIVKVINVRVLLLQAFCRD